MRKCHETMDIFRTPLRRWAAPTNFYQLFLCSFWSFFWENIARIANAVPCQSLFKGHNLIVDNVVHNWNEISVASVKSLGLLWNFSDFRKIFRLLEDFQKRIALKFSWKSQSFQRSQFFWKSQFFQKIPKFWNFLKIWKLSKGRIGKGLLGQLKNILWPRHHHLLQQRWAGG